MSLPVASRRRPSREIDMKVARFLIRAGWTVLFSAMVGCGVLCLAYGHIPATVGYGIAAVALWRLA